MQLHSSNRFRPRILACAFKFPTKQILYFFILGPIKTILDKSIIFYIYVNNRPVTYSMVTSVRWAAIFKKILTRYHSIRRVRASAVECRYNAVE